MEQVNKMLIIDADNVNHALSVGIEEIISRGVRIESRNGDTFEIPCPVTTIFHNPLHRVLMSKVRDANPFFHLMESMWILAGRDDVKFLTEFNKRMGDYSDDGVTFNAPYGHRLSNHFPSIYYGEKTLDQLKVIINMLRDDPNSRQAVAQIWDAKDLAPEINTKDKACNMSIVFRVRNGRLDITVYNRSNDMLWGAYGANVVQFSMIQEYVAACIGIPMGTYTHVSNAFHVYIDGPGGDLWGKLLANYEDNRNPYNDVNNIVRMSESNMDDFKYDLSLFFYTYDKFGLHEIGEIKCWKSNYFKELIIPMLCVYLVHKQNGPPSALDWTKQIKSDDWRIACNGWLENRITNLENK